MCLQENNDKEKGFLMNLFSFLRENTSRMDRFVLAVSGGPDSMVLLDLFLKLEASYPVKFCLANIDHRLRMESAKEQQWLKSFCKRKKIEFYVETVDIKEIKERIGAKKSLEQLAREERHKILEVIKKEFKARWIVMAHHQDDLLETFFLRLLRGTGLNGINTMNRVEGSILRPLLCYSKEELLNYAKENKLFYFQDESNDDVRFLRNKIRHQLLPFMIDTFGQEVKEILIRDIENLKSAETVINELIKTDLNRVTLSSDSVEIDQQYILQKSKGYIREFLVRMYQKWYNSTEGLTTKKINRICSRLFEKGDFEITITQSVRFLRSNDALVFEKKDGIEKNTEKQAFTLGEDFKKELEKKNVITTEVVFFSQRKTFTFQMLSGKGKNFFKKSKDENIAYLDYDKIEFPLIIRFWKEGDRIKPLGMKGFKKVSKLMTDKGIKKYQKRKQLIMENRKHDIIWCMGLRISEDYRLTSSTTRCLMISFYDMNEKDFEGRERYIPHRIDRDEEK